MTNEILSLMTELGVLIFCGGVLAALLTCIYLYLNDEDPYQ